MTTTDDARLTAMQIQSSTVLLEKELPHFRDKAAEALRSLADQVDELSGYPWTSGNDYWRQRAAKAEHRAAEAEKKLEAYHSTLKTLVDDLETRATVYEQGDAVVACGASAYRNAVELLDAHTPTDGE